MTVLVNDPDFILYLGDVLEVLAGLPDGSVHCVVTSPPYWGLRDYGTGSWVGGDEGCDHSVGGQVQQTKAGTDPNAVGVRPGVDTSRCRKCGARRQDQQLGLEPTPDQYVENMVGVFREVRRVLRADGTCWLNIGDSYNSGGGYSPDAPSNLAGSKQSTNVGSVRKDAYVDKNLKPKDLCGIPWRLAFALQQDGWYLRSEIIWAKPNPMPESVTDRPTKSHEQVFLLARSPRYFYDADAVREAQTTPAVGLEGRTPPPNKGEGRGLTRAGNRTADGWIPNGYNNPAGRNLRSVWNIPTEPYPDAHFATFPQALVEPCVKAGTSEHGCCPVCGAPWERMQTRSLDGESVALPAASRRAKRVDGTPLVGDNRFDIGTRASWAGSVSERCDAGWRPTCNCFMGGAAGERFASLTDPGVSVETGTAHAKTAQAVPSSDYGGNRRGEFENGATRRQDDLSEREAAPPIPCIVLDPFMGSGTVAMVCRRLGRRSIGIELNPAYAQLCAQRTRQLSLLAEPVIA